MANVNFLTPDVYQPTDSKVLSNAFGEPEKEGSTLFSSIMEQHKEQTKSGNDKKYNGNNEHQTAKVRESDKNEAEHNVDVKGDSHARRSSKRDVENNAELITEEKKVNNAKHPDKEYVENKAVAKNERAVNAEVINTTDVVKTEAVNAESTSTENDAKPAINKEIKTDTQLDSLPTAKADNSIDDKTKDRAEDLLSFLNAADKTLIKSEEMAHKQQILVDTPIGEKKSPELNTSAIDKENYQSEIKNAQDMIINNTGKRGENDGAIDKYVAPPITQEVKQPKLDKTLIAQSVSEMSDADENVLDKEIKKLLGTAEKNNTESSTLPLKDNVSKAVNNAQTLTNEQAINKQNEKIVTAKPTSEQITEKAIEKVAHKIPSEGLTEGKNDSIKKVTMSDVNKETVKVDEAVANKTQVKQSVVQDAEQVSQIPTRKEDVKANTRVNNVSASTVKEEKTPVSKVNTVSSDDAATVANIPDVSKNTIKKEQVDAGVTQQKNISLPTTEQKREHKFDHKMEQSPEHNAELNVKHDTAGALSDEELDQIEQALSKPNNQSPEKVNNTDVKPTHVNHVKNSPTTNTENSASIAVQTSSAIGEKPQVNTTDVPSVVVDDENTTTKDSVQNEKRSVAQSDKFVNEPNAKSPSQQQQNNSHAGEQSSKEHNANVTKSSEVDVDGVISEAKPFNSGVTTKPEVNTLFDNLSQREVSRISQQESRYIQHEMSFENVMQNISTEAIHTQKTASIQQAETISIMRKDFTDAVKEKVMVMINQKIQQVDIQLDPPEFGNMQVRVNIQNEQAVVSFIVQNQQAKEALEQNMDKLKHMMSENGVDVGEANVKQQSNQSSMQDQNGNRENGAGEEGENNTDEQFASAEQVKMVKASSTGVDYYA